MAKLITTYGGEAIVAPSMREVPLESNTEALALAAGLLDRKFYMVIFLTGVGTRGLLNVVEKGHKSDENIASLPRVKVVARGPEAVAGLGANCVTPAVHAA